MSTILKYSRESIFDFKNKNINLINLENNTILNDILKQIQLTIKTKSKKNDKDNGWKKKINRTNIVMYHDEMDKISKKININLNKLAEQNYSKILKNISEYITDENILEILINNIFVKCLEQHNYCVLYVKLLQEIYFTNKQYEEFAKVKLLEKSNNIINNMLSTENFEDSNYNDFCNNNKIKNSNIGCFKLIGELFNNNIICDIDIIINILNHILKDIETIDNKEMKELYFDCLSNLIIITKKNKKKVDENIIKIVEKMECLKNNKGIIHSKLKFKIMDFMDKFNK